MKPAAFDYIRAETADEISSALHEHGGEARVIAGGQSLVAMLNMRLAKPAVLVDVMRVKALGATVRSATRRRAPRLANGRAAGMVGRVAHGLGKISPARQATDPPYQATGRTPRIHCCRAARWRRASPARRGR